MATRLKNKKVKKKKSFLKRTLLFLLLVLLGVGGYTGYTIYKTYQAANQSYVELDRGEKSKLRESVIKVKEDPFSMLLMGIEDYSSGGENGRTDTLIVLTVNPTLQTIKMVSIPRDTFVSIPEEDLETKINHAYVYGGKELTIDTVENLLDIPIDYYATVSFQAFKSIVDELNGVSVNVPFDFWEHSDENAERIYFEEGPAILDGEEALAYARMRKRDPRGDFGRNDRQKEIISAIFDKATAPANIYKIDELAMHVSDNVETNFRISDALALIQKYPNINSDNIEKLTIEGEDDYINGIYYFAPDEIQLEEVKTELETHLEQ
ncbi:LCP family protein [Bacillus sp. AFS040349]|uniref:LCP family protein n=1 Tax=Bacillus sp. AFS040349 TaxID=2033502 RepID=UPI000BFB848C|nr:LCP family protein [Bacillus sp. AFS040349]PGT81092.1 LytR family transcriptional regulator [Bacillus sp. AFS040349]